MSGFIVLTSRTERRRRNETMALENGTSMAVRPAVAVAGGTHLILSDKVIIEARGGRILREAPLQILQA